MSDRTHRVLTISEKASTVRSDAATRCSAHRVTMVRSPLFRLPSAIIRHMHKLLRMADCNS